MLKIKTAADVHKAPLGQFIAGVIQMRRLNIKPPTETAEGMVLRAEIDHGRLIICCPFCLGAEMADLDTPKFFCLSCYNQQADGKWIKVTFPEGVR
jgi:hypothetical protein